MTTRSTFSTFVFISVYLLCASNVWFYIVCHTLYTNTALTCHHIITISFKLHFNQSPGMYTVNMDMKFHYIYTYHSLALLCRVRVQ